MSLSRFIQMGAAGPSGDDTFNPSDIADLEIWLDSSDTSYLFQDAGKITAVTANGDPVGCWADRSGNGYDHTVEGYDIAKASYDSVDFLTKASGTGPSGVFFKPDGTKFYITDNASDVIRQYSLSTAWDITTASEGTTKSISAQDGKIHAVFFKPDGTKLFLLGQNNNKVFEFDLSTDWDSSTASYNNVSFDFSTQETLPNALFFDASGTKMYMAGTNSDAVHQYGLSSAWDVSSASFTQSFSVLSEDSKPTAISFRPDGKRMVISGNENDRVYQYSLTSAFDISTASYDNVNISIVGQMTGPQGLFFKSDGTKMYALGFNNRLLRQYSTIANRPSYDTSTISGGSLFFDHTADSNYGEWLFNDTAKDTITAFFVVEVSSTLTGVLFGFDNSNNKYIHNDAGGAVYGTTPTSTFTNFNASSYTGFPVNTTSLLSADVCNFYRMNLTQYNPTTAFNYAGGSPDGTWIGRRANAPTDNSPFRGNIAEVITYSRRLSSSEIESVEDYLNTKWNLSLGYNIGRAVYDNKSFSVASQETAPTAIFFKPDGSKMYITGTTADSVFEFDLSTAFDVSTASYNSASYTYGSPPGLVEGLFFRADGLKWYIMDRGSDDVWEYDMSTAWDITSSSFSGNQFDVNNQDGISQSVFFKPDGTKFYQLGEATDAIYQYSMSVAWDVSSASYDSVSFSVSSQAGTPKDLTFKDDGTKFYVLNNNADAVYQFGLTTAWDISTASYDNVSFNVGSQEGVPTGLTFNYDGSKMYVVGSNNDTVYQYTTG